MSDNQQNLETKLWTVVNVSCGRWYANEFKNYILGFIFYKYLSEKIDLRLTNELKQDGLTFEQAYEIEEFQDDLKEEAIENLGYFIEPQYLFSNLVNQAKLRDENLIQNVESAFKKVEDSSIGGESAQNFENIFDDVDLQSSKLGRKVSDKNKIIAEIIKHLSEIDFELENGENDILGDAYEYLISQFASNAGKKTEEFYTPPEVSKILAKLVTLGKNRLKSVYDPTCGSGSLLLRVSKEVKVTDFYGQELNQTTFNLARMNMIIHDVNFNDFEIRQGDSLEEPQFMDMRFEAIVANPPFSARWSSDKKFLDDERFSAAGRLPPKSKADYAFIEHMIYHLDENGTMAIIVPQGVLFRGEAERRIRRFLIDERNYLDAVIGMPANLFYGTNIQTYVLVFKKSREENENILFIDASREFEKVKNQNRLREKDINKIVNTYINREEIDKYSHRASLEEIRENGFNLIISRYVDIFEKEQVDLDEVCNELEKISEEIKEVDAEIKKYCDELGIKAPLF